MVKIYIILSYTDIKIHVFLIFYYKQQDAPLAITITGRLIVYKLIILIEYPYPHTARNKRYKHRHRGAFK